MLSPVLLGTGDRGYTATAVTLLIQCDGSPLIGVKVTGGRAMRYCLLKAVFADFLL